VALACDHCGRATEPEWIAWSDYAQATICFRCYERVPQTWYVPPRVAPKPVPPPKPYKPDAYSKLFTQVREGLERCTKSTVFYMGVGQIASYCPVCRTGTVAFAFRDTNPPSVTPYSALLGPERCSLGCTGDEIAAALKAAGR
jgi:hypothetical protein